MNNIIRIKDNNGQLHSWVITDRIVNKYNPDIVTYEVELLRDRRITTQVFENDCYVGNNGRTYYRRAINVVDSGNFAKASFIYIRLAS